MRTCIRDTQAVRRGLRKVLEKPRNALGTQLAQIPRHERGGVMRFRISRMRWVSIAALAALLPLGCGESGNGGGGTGGSGGTGGTGGSGGTDGGISVVVPQCVTSAYQIVFRGFVEPMDPLLRYLDTPLASRTTPALNISSFVELKDVPGVYSRFTWNADDVPGVSDPGGTLITADFIEGCAERDPTNPAVCLAYWNLDNGIFDKQVTLVPWEMTVGTSTVVGAGKMSVVGLGPDTVRVTIVDFNPWYEGWANYCRFEMTSFQLQLNLAIPDSEPFAVIIGFRAEGSGYAVESGSVIFGEGNTASFSGSYKVGSAAAIPFDFQVDWSTDPASIEGTFGGVPTSCAIDLDTFVVSC
jgi:hypothetical protein